MARKKPSTFKLILILYVSILTAAVLILCLVVWNKLEAYQADYDAAKAAAQPEVYMTQFVEDFQYDTIVDAMKTYEQSEHIAASEQALDAHAKYFYQLVMADDVTYIENEQSAQNRPVYDLYAGGKRIAVISLKKSKSSDNFGFRLWETEELVFDTNEIDYQDYQIKAAEGMQICVDGTQLTQDQMVETLQDSGPVAEKAAALGGNIPTSFLYEVTDCIYPPEVVVTDSEGNILAGTQDENVFDYTKSGMDDFIGEVSDRVYQIVDTYIYNIYRKASFQEIAAFLAAKSEAYAVIKDVQATIAWGWKPDVVEIQKQSLSDFVCYSDTLFSCRYEGTVYKADDQDEETEDFRYQMLFTKSGGEWYLTYFILE